MLRLRFLLSILLIAGAAAEALALPLMRDSVGMKYDFVVAKDGSGDFTTVQAAIDAVPVMRQEARTNILIKPGVYEEKITIPAHKINVSLIGEGDVTLTYGDWAQKKNPYGEEYGTAGSASVYVYAPDFYAENITFENSAGPVGQAVAVYTDGDRAIFNRCRFLGNQDTLYTHDGRQYFEDCYIEGTVDFIFGKATALFNHCQLNAKRTKGYYTAPATPQGRRYGYVFYECDFTGDDGVEDVLISRPWRDYGQNVLVRCNLGPIHPRGYNNWRKPEREATSFYAEYDCHGPGADTSNRAFGHVLLSISGYEPEVILLGDDGWQPMATGPVATRVVYP